MWPLIHSTAKGVLPVTSEFSTFPEVLTTELTKRQRRVLDLLRSVVAFIRFVPLVNYPKYVYIS